MLRCKLTRFAECHVNKDTINIAVCTEACQRLRNETNRAMVRVVSTNCSDIIATDHDWCCKRSVTVTVSTVQGPSGKTNSICLYHGYRVGAGVCHHGKGWNGSLEKSGLVILPHEFLVRLSYRGADKSLALPGRTQSTATEDFDVHISYL